MQNAAACISVENSFTLPIYIVAFIVVLMLTTALTAVFWGIKRVFFRRANHFTMLALVSIILGIILGALATFAVPRFESVYQSFGVEIPMPTEFVFRFHSLLWLPLFLTAISFRRLRLQAAHLRYYLSVAMSKTMLLLLVLKALYAPIFKLGCA
jgi:small basic protein